MNKPYKPLLEKLGLTYLQYLAILVPWENDGSMVSSIGEHLHLTATGIALKTDAASTSTCIAAHTQYDMSDLFLLSKEIKKFRQQLMG